MADARVRTIDLENPFPESLEGMCELLLLRHGEQQMRRNIPLGEALDAPLSDLGQRQAVDVGERLSKVDIKTVHASPLTRAHDTGIQIARHRNLEPVIDTASPRSICGRARHKTRDFWTSIQEMTFCRSIVR